MPDFEIKADNACVDLAPLKPFNTTEGSRVVYSCASLQLNVQSVNGYCPVEFIVVVSFIDGGNRRKPPTCHKSLTSCIEYTSLELDSNSKR
jgi:hypothetical protein